MQEAVDDANAFIDSVGGLLPSAPVKTTLDELAKITKAEEPLAPVKSDNMASKTPGKGDANSKPTNLADALKKAEQVLEEVNEAGSSSKPAENLPQPLKEAPPAITDVGQFAGDTLASRPDEIKSAAGQSRSILGRVRLFGSFSSFSFQLTHFFVTTFSSSFFSFKKIETQRVG